MTVDNVYFPVVVLLSIFTSEKNFLVPSPTAVFLLIRHCVTELYALVTSSFICDSVNRKFINFIPLEYSHELFADKLNTKL